MRSGYNLSLHGYCETFDVALRISICKATTHPKRHRPLVLLLLLLLLMVMMLLLAHETDQGFFQFGPVLVFIACQVVELS